MTLHDNYGPAIEHLESMRAVDDDYSTGIKFAYICHDKDKGRFHYHFYIEYENARHHTAIAKEFNVLPNMVQYVISKKGMLRYLIHAGDADKHQYDKDDIIANFDINEAEQAVDVLAEIRDFKKVRAGLMTMEEYAMSHKTYFTSSCFSAVSEEEGQCHKP